MLFGASPQDVRVLDSAKYYFRKRRDRLESRYTAAGTARAIAFAESASAIVDVASTDEVAVLAGIEQIDAGEAILFASTNAFSDGVMLTGDKRALVALARAEPARNIYDRLQGRVLCLESILTALIDRRGFAFVNGRVTRGIVCDTAIRAAFGSGPLAEEKTVLESLTAYIADLEERVGKGWLYRDIRPV